MKPIAKLQNHKWNARHNKLTVGIEIAPATIQNIPIILERIREKLAEFNKGD